MISGASVLLHLPLSRSQRHGARRRPRCRRARSSTSGLRSNTEGLSRLGTHGQFGQAGYQPFPAEPMGRSFLFREARLTRLRRRGNAVVAD